MRVSPKQRQVYCPLATIVFSGLHGSALDKVRLDRSPTSLPCLGFHYNTNVLMWNIIYKSRH